MERADFALSLELIAAVRDAVGPNVDIMIEAHNRFSPHTALQFADAMAKYQPTWFEAPVPPQYISQMVEVAKRSPVPIACGEDYYSPQQFAELLSSRCCSHHTIGAAISWTHSIQAGMWNGPCPQRRDRST